MRTFHFQSLAPAAVAALLVANLSAAQDAPRRPDAARDGERPQGGPREGGFRGGPGGFQPLELTEDQREALRTAMEEHRDDNMALGEKMRDARKAYNDAAMAEKPDQDKIRAAAKEVANLQAEMMVVQAKIFTKVRSKLTTSQLEQIKNSPAGMMLLGGLGGPGMGRPGFGGPGGPRPDGPGARPDGEGRRPRPEGDGPTPTRRPSRPEAEKNQ